MKRFPDPGTTEFKPLVYYGDKLKFQVVDDVLPYPPMIGHAVYHGGFMTYPEINMMILNLDPTVFGVLDEDLVCLAQCSLRKADATDLSSVGWETLLTRARDRNVSSVWLESTETESPATRLGLGKYLVDLGDMLISTLHGGGTRVIVDTSTGWTSRFMERRKSGLLHLEAFTVPGGTSGEVLQAWMYDIPALQAV